MRGVHSACAPAQGRSGASMREDARSGRNATDRKWLPRNLALSALVLALATITLLLRRDATQRNALASLPGEAEYGVAQAKAKILADQVEVDNAKKRLAQLKRWLDSSSGAPVQAQGAKGQGNHDAAAKLRDMFMQRAAKADSSAQSAEAVESKADLTGLKLTPQEKTQEQVEQSDESLLAAALRKAALRAAGTKAEKGHEMAQYLAQYHSAYQLRVGTAREQKRLAQAERAVRADAAALAAREHAQAASRESKTSNLDSEEATAMAIEQLEKRRVTAAQAAVPSALRSAAPGGPGAVPGTLSLAARPAAGTAAPGAPSGGQERARARGKATGIGHAEAGAPARAGRPRRDAWAAGDGGVFESVLGNVEDLFEGK